MTDGSKAAKGDCKMAKDDNVDQPILSPAEQRRQVRTHYYVKIAVCTFLCALLLIIGVPVFMESRVTGSLAYTALGVVLVLFGMMLAAAVIILLLRPPFNKDGTYR